MGPRETVIAMFACLLSAGASQGCLDDLDEPLTCLPPPERTGAAASCFSAVAEDPNAFDERLCTVEPEVLSCFRDPARGCACGDDCPPPTASCHPAPDCPAEVLARYPTAKCVQLAPEDLGPFQDESDQCLCGCEACLLSCDGRGPIWSQVDVADENGQSVAPSGVLTLDVQRHLPVRGRAGLFIRARGLTAGTGQNDEAEPPVVLTVSDDLEEPTGIGQLPALMSDRFETVLYPRDELLSWSAKEERPTLFALSNDLGAFSLYEIDCVVPFIVE